MSNFMDDLMDGIRMIALIELQDEFFKWSTTFEPEKQLDFVECWSHFIWDLVEKELINGEVEEIEKVLIELKEEKEKLKEERGKLEEVC